MDTIADFLTIIKNGYLARKKAVSVNSSKMRVEIAKILKNEGYIADYKVVEAQPVSSLMVTLRYFEKHLPAVTGIKRTSKPSVRVYSAVKDIPLTLSGSGLTIVSTPAGLLSSKDAKAKNLGGEVIAQIW